jgi:hypothetical protein
MARVEVDKAGSGGRQEVVSMTNKGQRITAIALNPTRKLLAFTEEGERPLLVVYDLERRKRVKLLRCAEFRTKQVESSNSYKFDRAFAGGLAGILPRLQVPAGPGRRPRPPAGLLLLGEGEGG